MTTRWRAWCAAELVRVGTHDMDAHCLFYKFIPAQLLFPGRELAVDGMHVMITPLDVKVNAEIRVCRAYDSSVCLKEPRVFSAKLQPRHIRSQTRGALDAEAIAILWDVIKDSF